MHKRNVAVAALVAAGLILAPGLSKAFSPKKAEQSFQQFCSGWMTKLREREVRNEKLVRFERYGDSMVGDYAGYDRNPMRCEVKATGVPEAPFVGKIVYNELLYRKSGGSTNRARTSSPTIIGQTQVLEIFRFSDGDWQY